MTALITSGLSKTYYPDRHTGVEALKPLDLHIEQGEIFGLLGPNGAGKTTLIKLLLGIIRPTAGHAAIHGQAVPSQKARAAIGYLPENHRFPGYMSGRQLMELCGNLCGMRGAALHTRIDELLRLVSMNEWGNVKIRKYSKGMMQRLGIAQAMVNSPRILFLDEPTDGIDPIGRKDIRDILLRVRNQGTTVFLNSHLLSEVELITDRVAILNKGIVVKTGTTAELTEQPDIYEIKIQAPADFRPAELPGAPRFDAATSVLTVQAASPQVLNALIDGLRTRQVLIQTIGTKRNTLESLFFELINNA